jgi:hypothetical protein
MTKLYFASDDALVALTIEGTNARCDLHLRGNKIACVTVDPLCPRLIYCGTFGSGLWSSDNAGEGWRPVGKGVRHSKVQSVTVSRSERINGRGVVYVGTEPSAVFRSEDGGETWEECGGLTTLPSAIEWSFPPRPETHHVRWIEADPHVQGRLFVAVEAGALIRSADSGTTWQDRLPATAISRAATAAILGNDSRKGYSTDTSGVSPSIRRMRITSSFRQPPPHGTPTMSRRNRISIDARRVLRGSNSEMACPIRSDAELPFWPVIRGSRECSSRLGSATCIIQSTAERAGTV